jgi:hypothetical protein
MSDQLYKGFRPDEMEYQYNPRESVPEYPELAKVRAGKSKRKLEPKSTSPSLTSCAKQRS